jgi:xanthine dehydrogenase YagS FAD-binding subunit
VNRFSWIEPEDVQGALLAGALEGALFKAGGVDVADRLKEGLEAPSALVNLRRLGELDFLREEDGALVIGPLVTLHRLATDEKVLRSARALALAAGAAATPQIRNMATVGGNLAQRPRCWYFRNEHFHCRKKGGTHCFAIDGEHEFHSIFDNSICAAVHPSGTATALVALGAEATLRSSKGERKVPLEELFTPAEKDVTRENTLQHGEIIAALRVPRAERSSYSKLMQKQSFDWPLAEAAVSLVAQRGMVTAARIVLGAAAHVPRRALAAEKSLTGRILDESAIADAARLAVDGATPLQRNGYKVDLFKTLVRDLLAEGARP